MVSPPLEGLRPLRGQFWFPAPAPRTTMLEPGSARSPHTLAKSSSGGLAASARTQTPGRFGIDLKARSVSLSPATFKETVQQLARLLGKHEEQEGTRCVADAL